MNKKLFLLALIFGFFYLILGTVSLKHYAVNWDEPVHFLRGHSILHYFLTGEKSYSEDTNSLRKSYYKMNNYNYKYFEDQISNAVEKKRVEFAGGGHPPLSDLLAAISNYVLYTRLGVLGDIESYHFYSVFLSSFLAACLFYFVARQYNVFAGLIALLSFALYPLFLGESRFNIKDMPEAVFYSLTLIAFYKGITESNIRWVFLSALFFGFALGTKLNIVFIPITILPWLIIFYAKSIIKEGIVNFFKKRKLLFISFFLYPIIGLSILISTWPILWPDILNRLMTILSYYQKIGISTGSDSRFTTFFGLNTYPIQWIVYTTPLVIIFLFLAGAFYTAKNGLNERNKTALFILLWLIVPVVRVIIPGAAIYGGVRQIAEYIPAMAILAGIGAYYLVQSLKFKVFNFKLQPVTFIFELLIVLMFIPITFKIISLYPFESVYFNELIGGLKGAKEKNIPGWGNSLGSTYLKGVEWLNNNINDNARLATIYELRSNIPDFLLRKDINYANKFRSMTRREGEYIIGVTHSGAYDDQYHRRYLETYLNSLYEVKVDGVALLKIWKNDLVRTKEAYRKEEQEVENIKVQKGENNTLLVKLGNTVKITKIVIYYDPRNCTPPTSGYFEYSFVGGLKWTKAGGDFQSIPFSTWFKTQPENGMLQFLFAAEPARFIQLVIYDKDSCLLKENLDTSVFYL